MFKIFKFIKPKQAISITTKGQPSSKRLKSSSKQMESKEKHSWNIKSTITLNNGTKMPRLGFGTFMLEGEQVKQPLRFALECGYIHIDTAKYYKNEKDIGEVLKERNIARDSIFVTTKLWPSDHGYDKAIAACDGSLKRLGLEYVDLYLIHYPGSLDLAKSDPNNAKLRTETWRAFEQLYKDGKCKAIGVSNYTTKHLEGLLEVCKIKPAVNQVEFHPLLTQVPLLKYCSENEIVLEGYSQFCKGDLLKDKEIIQFAEKYNKTPAQILVRWGLQHNCVMIPKATVKKRMEENAGVFDFEISQSDMEKLDGMNKNYHCTWDPTKVA